MPTPIGVGAPYHPAAHAGPDCRPGRAQGRRAFHLELFANRRVVILPAGIGVGVSGCRTTATTIDPTGVIWFAPPRMTLAEVFAAWGERLDDHHLLTFTAQPGRSVVDYLNGRRQRGEIASIRVRSRDELVLEINGYVPPHARYLFPRG